MSVPVGKHITASQLEEMTVSWGSDGPTRFEALAGSIAAWEAFRCGAVANQTGRVHDPGWDAEVVLTRPADASFLKEGRNLVEYKWSSRTTRRLSTLKSRLQPWPAKLREEAPAQFVLVTNLDLSVADKAKLLDFLKTDSVQITILDAAAISQYANRHTALLAGHFWSGPWVDYFRFRNEDPSELPFVGRAQEIAAIHAHLSEPGRLVLLTGPPGVGKTRLAVQAMAKWSFSSIILEPAMTAEPGLLRRLQSPQNTILIDEPDPLVLEYWVRQSLASEARVLITLRKERPLLGAWALDPRIRHLDLRPLPTAEVLTLLNHAGRKLDPPTRAWLAQQAGHSLLALTLAASAFSVLSTRPVDWKTALAYQENLRAQAELDPASYSALQRLSLLPWVESSELDLLELTGSSPELDKLLGGQWVQERDQQYRLTSLPLAHLLADKLLRVDPKWQETLLARGPVLRFLQRLIELDTPSVWSRVKVALSRFFTDFSDLEKNGSLLLMLTDHNPQLSLEQMRNLLAQDDPTNLQGGARRNAVWVLDRLLTRRETALQAMTLLSRLAEAENETFSNSASGILRAALRPMAPVYALATDRLWVVQDCMSPTICDLLLSAMAHPSVSFVASFPTAEPQSWYEKAQRQEFDQLMNAYLEHLVTWLSSHTEFATDQRLERLLSVVREQFTPTDEQLLKLFRLIQHYPALFSHKLIQENQHRPELQGLLESDQWLTLLYGNPTQNNLPTAENEALLRRLIDRPAEAPQSFWKALAVGEGQASVLLYELGQLDTESRLLPRLLEVFSAHLTARWEILATYVSTPTVLTDFLKARTSPSVQMRVLSKIPASDITVPVLASLVHQDPDFSEQLLDRLTLIGWSNVSAPLLLDFLKQVDQIGLKDSHVSDLLFEHHCAHRPLLEWLSDFLKRGSSEPHDWERLASLLAEHDHELGLQLFETTLSAKAFREEWHPLESRLPQSLVEALAQIHFTPLVDRVAQTFREEATGDFGSIIPFMTRNGAIGKRHKSSLIEWATISEENALFLCEVVAARTDDFFWTATRALIQQFPPESAVSRRLEAVLTEAGGRGQEIRRQLESPFPSAGWLASIQARLEASPELPSLVWEYDLSSKEFLALLDNPESPDRKWVLSRILRELPWAEARKYVNKSDLAQLLPELNIPERKKRALQSALEIWDESA